MSVYVSLRFELAPVNFTLAPEKRVLPESTGSSFVTFPFAPKENEIEGIEKLIPHPDGSFEPSVKVTLKQPAELLFFPFTVITLLPGNTLGFDP